MSERFPKDSRNYSIANKFTAFFAEETSPGSGSFNDFLPMGNIVDSTFASELEELEHLTNFAGISRKDKEVVITAGGTFTLTLDELVCHNLRWIMGSSTRTTGATIVVPREETVSFSGTSPGSLVVNGGAAIDSSISLYDPDCTRYVEGTDFSVVKGTATYTRIGSAIPVSGTVKALFNISKIATSYPIMDLLNIEGKLKVVNLAPEVGPGFMIDLFRTRIRVEGDIGFSKDDWRTADLQCEMLEDDNGKFGSINMFD